MLPFFFFFAVDVCLFVVTVVRAALHFFFPRGFRQLQALQLAIETKSNSKTAEFKRAVADKSCL